MINRNFIVILVGVCGTGKSAVGQKLARTLEVPFFDAEKLPAFNDLPEGKLPQDVNLEKWLTAIKELIIEQSSQQGCVLSCSVLKREHRKLLGANMDHLLDWVFMSGSYEVVAERVHQIEDHDRSESLLKSDFATLEVPKRALTIDITYSEEEIVDTILKYLERKYE